VTRDPIEEEYVTEELFENEHIEEESMEGTTGEEHNAEKKCLEEEAIRDESVIRHLLDKVLPTKYVHELTDHSFSLGFPNDACKHFHNEYKKLIKIS
jgi:hypothetical protein